MNEYVRTRTTILCVIGGLLLSANMANASWFHRREKLVWVENFDRRNGAQLDPAVWTYEEGGNGWGNKELEVYCAYDSSKVPCDPAKPNAFVGDDGYLHIVARKTPGGQYTSARLLTKNLKTFRYGRFEARIRIPSGQGMWPAFWLLGEDIDTAKWPACGELDVMENIGKEPDTIHGSIHGKGFPGPTVGTTIRLPDSTPFAARFHTFGMIWRPGSIAYYVDDPKKPYAVDTPRALPAGAVWPFDSRRFFLLLNLAIGGGWPGNPDQSSVFPSEMLVDYVKVWELR
jgi:beta-glucanase (GH16 family)